MPTPKQILKIAAMAVYLFILTGIGAQLFFEDQLNALASAIFQSKQSVAPSAQRIAIGYALPVSSLEPTLFDAVTRSRLADVYEGLVRTDRNLKIQPAIAVAWGLLDPLTWEFKLRPEVKFHNGTLVTAKDIAASIDRALHLTGSQLTNLLNTIERVDIIDPKTIQIKTSKPDPLLLNKLAVTFIFPQTLKDFEHPIGTGPYTINSTDKDNLILKRFNAYYGYKPYYPEVVLETILDKRDRLKALRSGAVHMLVDVPPAAVAELRRNNFSVASVPSLEVDFLMFNLEDAVLKNKDMRMAVAEAVDRKKFVELAGGFARPVGQFVSSGVFGFNPTIIKPEFNLENARKQLSQFYTSGSEQPKLVLDFPQELEIIGQYLQSQMHDLGLQLDLNPIAGSDLQNKIRSGTSQFYYLGWRSELGDASDFLQAIAHSRDKSGLYGRFNGNNYVNGNVDMLIEKSQYDLNAKTRLKILQDAMKTLVEEDVIGVPLFEADTLFAFNKNIHFEPRVDGYIYANEIN